jgi:hypothetical protein
MAHKAIEDTNYEIIKAHILNPEDSPLPDDQKEMLDRISSAAKILDKNPFHRNAVAILMHKYPNIGKNRAYADLRLASRLFNSIHSFDYDFWHTWLINDIVRNIQNCENQMDASHRKIIAIEHANLLKAIGEKPEEVQYPAKNEKHQFYLLIQNNNQQIKIDVNNLGNLPPTALRELNKIIFTGEEITEDQANQIMKT